MKRILAQPEVQKELNKLRKENEILRKQKEVKSMKIRINTLEKENLELHIVIILTTITSESDRYRGDNVYDRIDKDAMILNKKKVRQLKEKVNIN